MTDGSFSSFASAVKKYSSILIYIQGSPDPDAIASAYALRVAMAKMNIRSDIVSGKKLSLSQNRAFVKALSIPLNAARHVNTSAYDAYVVVDFQSNIVEGVSGILPCAVHIDHHEPGCNNTETGFSLIDPEAGSTSSLVTGLLMKSGIDFTPQEMKSVSTALIFGIQTDTDDFAHASEIDLEAMRFLSAYSDRETINRISGIPLSPETMTFYKKALENELVYRDWGIYGIGYIDIEHRDSLAIAADLLLKNTGHNTVAVLALVEDRPKDDLYIDVALRTVSDTLDLNAMIKKISPTGGGRKYKGAYQVKMRYFRLCPDREMLWKTVESATHERIKKAREGMYLEKIRNVAVRALDRISSFLKNK